MTIEPFATSHISSFNLCHFHKEAHKLPNVLINLELFHFLVVCDKLQESKLSFKFKFLKFVKIIASSEKHAYVLNGTKTYHEVPLVIGKLLA